MATPESIKPKSAVWEENGAMESRSFPAALHGAAFVSSEGKVYRLFAEDESPSLGETLRFDPFENGPLPPEKQDGYPILPMTLRFFSDSAAETAEAAERIGDSFDDSAPSTLPLDEALRRLRAVEGTWGRRSAESSIRIFDSMSQSVTARSRQVLGRVRPPELIPEKERTEKKYQQPIVRRNEIVLHQMEEPFENDEKKERDIIRLFETVASPRMSETETMKAATGQTGLTDKPKNVAGPFRHSVSVTEKLILISERDANLTSESRPASVRPAETSLELLEQPIDNAPPLIGRPRPEAEKTVAKQKETVGDDVESEKSSSLLQQHPAIEERTTFESVSLGEDLPLSPPTPSKPGEQTAAPISLIRVVMPLPQRRSGFVPQKETVRYRTAKKHPEKSVETKISVVTENASVLEEEAPAENRFEITTQRAKQLKATVIQEGPAEKNLVAVEEPLSETAVVEEGKPLPSDGDVLPPEIPKTANVRPVSFRWPSVCDALKKKAGAQICSLADYLIALKEHKRKTICFHGFFPSEGCSTVLLCAVRELTDRGFNVLLVDANVRNPELTMLLDVPASMGNGERLSLINRRLELLPLIENSSGMGTWRRGKTLELSKRIGLLKDSYDLILIDAGSLTEGGPSEKALFWQGTAADGVLLVINTKNRQPVNLEAVGTRLHQHGIELLGVSENYV